MVSASRRSAADRSGRRAGRQAVQQTGHALPEHIVLGFGDGQRALGAAAGAFRVAGAAGRQGVEGVRDAAVLLGWRALGLVDGGVQHLPGGRGIAEQPQHPAEFGLCEDQQVGGKNSMRSRWLSGSAVATQRASQSRAASKRPSQNRVLPMAQQAVMV
jgi:hypothetical protein